MHARRDYEKRVFENMEKVYILIIKYSNSILLAVLRNIAYKFCVCGREGEEMVEAFG